MKPTIGRIVIYVLDDTDAKIIESRRGPLASNVSRPGQELPMIITRAWGVDKSEETVNGQVFLDGPYQYWVTSVHEGDGPGKWHWPVKA